MLDLKELMLDLVVSRRQNGHVESKPLTVPKDIDLQLESVPVNVLDALGKFLHQNCCK